MKTSRMILGIALILNFGKLSAQLPGQKQAVKPCKDCSWVEDNNTLKYKNTKNDKVLFETKAASVYFSNPAYKHLWIRKDEKGSRNALLLDTRTNDFLIDFRNEADLSFEFLVASKNGAGENITDHIAYIQVKNDANKTSNIYTLEGKKVWEGKSTDPLGNLSFIYCNKQIQDMNKDWCFFNDEKGRLFNAKLEDVTKSYYVENPLRIIPIKTEEVAKYEYKTLIATGKEKKIGKGFDNPDFYSIELKTEVVFYSKTKVPFARIPLNDNFMYNLKGSDGKTIEVMLQPFKGKVGPPTFTFSNTKRISFDAKGVPVYNPVPQTKAGKWTLVDESYLVDEEGYRVFTELNISRARILPDYEILLYTDYMGQNQGHDLKNDKFLFQSESSVDKMVSENGKYALTKNGIWGFEENKLVNTKIYPTTKNTVRWWGNNLMERYIGSIKYDDRTENYDEYTLLIFKGNGVWEKYPEEFQKILEESKDKIKLTTKKGATLVFSSTGKKLN